MRASKKMAWLLATIFLIASGIALAQDAGQNRTLFVAGQSGNVPVIQVNGRSYVDLDALAQVVNGSLTYSGDRIVLALPSSSANAPAAPAAQPAAAQNNSAPAPAPAPASNPGFSRGFLRAGIEEMATLREWHTALATAIQTGTPLDASWLTPYRNQVTTNLRLVSLAVQTDADRRAFQLLNNEFQHMAKLSDKYVAKRANLSYISPDALQNDDLNQRIIACGHSLGAMAASGQFSDDGTCN